MKKMNRREFLTLTGASVALLALAACGGAPSTPVVPTTGEEAKVLEAIDKITPNIEVVVTVSANAADLPEDLKKFVI